MKILAIEDQPMAAMLMASMLRSLGHEVELAQDGAAAWTLIAKGTYRVVVSDWRMRGMDGLDLCRKLRETGGDYVYFILVSTTKITKASREEALAAGVDDFLSKPVDPDELGMRLRVAERIIRFSAQVKTLESFLPICGYCKKIRTDGLYWQEIETYLEKRQGTQFSHGVCPECYEEKIVPQIKKLGIDPRSLSHPGNA